MAGELFGFAAFRSRQQTTAFELALKKQGINCRIITTPHEIGMGCGLSVRFALDDMKSVMSISDKMKQSALIGIYGAELAEGKLVFKPVTRAMRYGI
jgi:hypothetical protein